MIAVDLPLLVLGLGIVALCVTTIITGLSLPMPVLRRRRPAAIAPVRELEPRRVVTGAPVRLPPIPLPAAPRATAPSPTAPRQAPTVQDGPVHEHTVREAEHLVERLLDDDPERLAEIMTQWIRSDTPEHGQP